MDDASTISIHRRVWDLIPWLVNDTASADERRLVEDHVTRCEDCRDELVFHRALQAGMTVPPLPHTGTDPEPALSRLLARIDRSEQDASNGRSAAAPWRQRRSRWIGGLAAVVAVQAIGLGALAGLLYGRPPPMASYETLSRAPVPSGRPTMRLVVAPEMRIGELRSLLDRAGMQIVHSSGDGTVLGLAPTAAGLPAAKALDLLRATPQVLLAEPVQTAEASAR